MQRLPFDNAFFDFEKCRKNGQATSQKTKKASNTPPPPPMVIPESLFDEFELCIDPKLLLLGVRHHEVGRQQRRRRRRRRSSNVNFLFDNTYYKLCKTIFAVPS